MKKVFNAAFLISVFCLCSNAWAEMEPPFAGSGAPGFGAAAENKDAVAERIEYRGENGQATENVMMNQAGRIVGSVVNKGNMVIAGLKTRIEVDGMTVREDNLTLAPGASQEVTWNYAFTSPGRHTVALSADPDRQVDETQENNNRVEKAVNVNAPAYGVAASSLECNIAGGARNVNSVQQGQQVEIVGTVTNNGNAPMGRVKIALLLDGTPLRDSTIALEPGRTATLTRSYVFNASGQHRIAFAVDTDNSYQETNEGNNRIERTIEITSNNPPAPGPSSVGKGAGWGGGSSMAQKYR